MFTRLRSSSSTFASLDTVTWIALGSRTHAIAFSERRRSSTNWNACAWSGERFASALGREPPRVFEGAGHFLQEDRGEDVGAAIADWLG